MADNLPAHFGGAELDGVIHLWFYDELQQLRVGNMIANAAWGIYNLVTGLHIVAFGRMATVAINAIAYRQNMQAPEK